jgi:Beta-ketoacyl synthase, N-terminal domain/Phosphopantetheine attachment site
VICSGGHFTDAASFDSLSAVELSNAIGALFGLQLPALLAFDHPSVDAIAQHISTLVGAHTDGQGRADMDPPVPPGAGTILPVTFCDVDGLQVHRSDDVALDPRAYETFQTDAPLSQPSCLLMWNLVTLATGWLMMPLQVTTAVRVPTSHWEGTRFGAATNVDAVNLVPHARWDVEEPAFIHLSESGQSIHRSRFGGFMDAVDEFDARLFSIADGEANLMDPQQRLLLEVILCFPHILFVCTSAVPRSNQKDSTTGGPCM